MIDVLAPMAIVLQHVSKLYVLHLKLTQHVKYILNKNSSGVVAYRADKVGFNAKKLIGIRG